MQFTLKKLEESLYRMV